MSEREKEEGKEGRRNRKRGKGGGRGDRREETKKKGDLERTKVVKRNTNRELMG